MLKKYFALSFVIFLLTACSVEVRSNKDAAYEKKLERVLISNSLSNADGDRFNGTKVALGLTDKLTKHAVTVQTFAPQVFWKNSDKVNALFGITVRTFEPFNIKPETENEKILQEAIAAFKPSQILELIPISTESQAGIPYIYIMAVKIYDPATMKTVWQSSIELSDHSPLRLGGLNTDKVVSAIIQKLEADGMLSLSLTK